MSIRIGINGFGRIGRYVTRLLAGSCDLELVAVNARGDNATLAHLLKYDSVHGTFGGDVVANQDGFDLCGKQVKVTRHGANEWTWKDLGVDLVLETTGKFVDRDACAKHLECGAKKAIISAPGKNADVTIVMGVNQGDYIPAKHDVISAASCTTNCLAPAAKVLHETFGIKHGLMTTVHSYTMSQRILDGTHKDLRRARAACMSMLPTTTGAAKAVAMVIPDLAGKLDGMAVRVPTPNVSLVDLTLEVEKTASKEAVNAALKAAAAGPLLDNMGYTETPLVSIDYTGSTYGGVVDGLCTNVIDGHMIKIVIWYDNESGFTNQLLRLTRMVAAGM